MSRAESSLCGWRMSLILGGKAHDLRVASELRCVRLAAEQRSCCGLVS